MTDVRNQPSRFTAWRLFVLLEVANRDAVAEEIDKRANSNSATTTIMTRLRWGAFFLVLLFLVIQLIPRALGQRDASKRSSDVEIPLPKQQPAPLEPAVCSSWTATGSLNTGRTHHTATLLLNGMVLVAGGGTRVDLASAELYETCTPNTNSDSDSYTESYSYSKASPDFSASPNAAAVKRNTLTEEQSGRQGQHLALSLPLQRQLPARESFRSVSDWKAAHTTRARSSQSKRALARARNRPGQVFVLATGR
jgi:hypothetical protein